MQELLVVEVIPREKGRIKTNADFSVFERKNTKSENAC